MDERLHRVASALAARERLALLRVLADGNASVGQLVARTGLAEVLEHLDVLSGAGLVAAGIDGRFGLASVDVLVLVNALETVARGTEDT